MSNPTILPIPTILDAAKLGLSYAIRDINKKNAFQGGVVNERIPELIYLIYKSVNHRYESYPSDPTLRDTANLLWRLLGKYGLQALNRLQGGGSVVINPNIGLLLIPYRFPVLINSVDFPSGATSYIYNFRSFGTGNSDVTVVLQNQIVNPLTGDTIGDFTYAVVFGATTTTITFQQNGTPTAPYDDQIMIINGFKYA